MRNMNRIYRSHTSRCNNKIMFAMHFCQVRLPDRRLCNYLQNVGATTYKNFLQFYAKSACKKHDMTIEDIMKVRNMGRKSLVYCIIDI